MSQAGRYIPGTGAPPIETLTGNDSIPVGPDASGNIDLLGNNTQGINITNTSANTLTVAGIDATTSQKGVVETSTDAESIAGASLTVAVTPASLAAKLGSQTLNTIPYGNSTSGAVQWTAAGTDGQLVIAATGGAPAFASLASSDGFIEYTPGANSLDLTIEANAKTAAINGWDGSIIETTSVTVTSDGATITLSVEKSGGGDLTVVFSDGFYTWDTTPADTVTLTAGSDTSPTLNYIYFLQSTKTLTASTVGFPATEFAPIAEVLCQSAASLQTDGAYKVHVYTDHIISSNNEGHIQHLNYWIRQQNATWVSGVAPTLTITPNVGTPDNVIFTSTAGIVLQLHEHTFPAFTGTPDIYVVNDSGTPYTVVTDLNALLTDASGNSLVGSYFSLVIWGVVNEDTGDCKLMCNLPTGSYNNQSSLVADPDKYTVYTIPQDFVGVGFLIAELQLREQSASGGTWTEIDTIDLRGQLPSKAAGGGTAFPTEFPDNTFRIFDDGDNTKQIAFQASGITTATTRTLTVQDADGTVALSGVANYGTGATSFTAYAPVCGGTTSTNPLQSADSGISNSGYVLTSTGSSSLPTWQATATAFTWNVSTGSTQACAVNNGYFANYNGTLAFTLPSTAAVGDTIQIAQMYAGQGFTVAVNTGETIYIGNTNTTITTGTLASTDDGDWIELVCRVADTDWQCNVKSGNITVT